MYIKLTRTDGSPIWLNAAFVVTIEPHRNSGSLVVPIGDGLDYEVKESPEKVLAMLEGTPVPAVVPVPYSDALTATPDDVSPEEQPSEEDGSSLDVFKAAKTGGEKTNPAKKTATRRSKAKAAKPEESEDRQTPPTAKKKSPAKSRTRKKAELELEESELERLRKLAPKTLKKLGNTVSSQFKVSDVEKTVEALEASGIITLDGERVIWTDPV